MIDKVGKVSNPLTIVAIFAAIVEISASSVLPFLSAINQSTYIWFLMIFPTILVIFFFVTLNVNHRVLYAPSDWRDEANFFRPPYERATRQEKLKKIEVEIADENEVPDVVPNPDDHSISQAFSELDPNFPGQQVQKYRLLLVESEVKNLIASRYGQLVPEQAIFGKDGNRYIFDGIIRAAEFDWFLEIKYLKFGQNANSAIKNAMRQISTKL